MKKLFALFLFFTNTLFANTNDSLKIPKKVFPLKYYTINQFEYRDSVSYIENSLLDFQNYLPKNTLGNVGLPLNELIYKPSHILGFNYQNNYYQRYFYTPFTLKFYNTRIPYTDIFNVFGSKKEQYFKLTFSYNIKKNWNMSAYFSRIKSLGFYQHQKTDHTSLALSSNYKTLNNRYMLLASAAVNTVKNEENGGMVNDSAFYNGSINPGISLIDARNFRFNKNFFAKQYINFGHKVNDTAPVIPASRIILTSYYDDLAMKYIDVRPLANYYKNNYFDPQKSFDTCYVRKIENDLTWKRVDNLKRRGIQDMIGVGIGVKHQYIRLKQIEPDSLLLDTLFKNLIGHAELSNLYSKNKFWWKLNGEYGYKGYNKEDYELSALLIKGWKDSLSRVWITAKTKKYVPDFMYTAYNSNHFRWFNQFQKITEQTIGTGLILNKYDLSLGLDYTNYTNVVYFDTSAIAQQYEGKIPVISATLRKNFSLYHFHLNNKIQYQHVPDSSVIRVPEFILQHSLYYENDLFKKALTLQIGFQVFYNTAYYANAYMPATGQFYIQNKNEYGNYPVIDFFLNCKIKVVNIFFKIDHLNTGLSGNTYILTPHYILNQRSFKLGVSWKFWD